MSIEIGLSDKKLAMIEYEPILHDLHQNDKLLEACEKDEDDAFILPEFQLDQLESLALSPDTMILASDILPSSSIRESLSNVRQMCPDHVTELTPEHKSQFSLQTESCGTLNRGRRDIFFKDDALKDHPSRAFVFGIADKQNENRQRAECTKLKDNKLSSLRKKRNKLSLSCDKVSINSNNINNNNTSADSSEDNRVMAVVAISTNKVSNMTQIVINTGKEEQVYQGKTTELLQVTENFPEISNVDSSAVWNNTVEYANNSYNKGHDLVISKALEELGINDDVLQNSNVAEHGKVWHCLQEDCTRKFARLYALKCHLLTHYGIRPFKCDFNGCSWSFFSEFKLKRHKETHLKRKDYICKIADCKRRFTTIYNLWSHEKLHTRPSKIICHVPDCQEKFQTKRALELHMKSHDQSHAPYVCKHEGCDKRYYSNNALTSHQRCHSYKETDIKCSWAGCGKIFDKPCRLKAHMRSHTGLKPYLCTFQDCQWAFSSSSKLKRHQKKHTNERKFVCDTYSCGKAFMRSEHLKEHKLTHNEGRYFRCDLCDSKFSAKSSLYVHIKKHHRKESVLSPYKNSSTETRKLRKADTLKTLKSDNQNISLFEDKSKDEADYVFYMDKMIMLTTPCDTVIFNTSNPEDPNNINDNVSSIKALDSQDLKSPEEAGVKNDQGSARTRLTLADVTKLKASAHANSIYPPITENNIGVTDDILSSTDISEELLFNEDLSSMYYQDEIESTECQVLLLDPNSTESVSLI